MRIADVVSQSDVLRAMLRDRDALGAFPAVKTVEQLFGRKDVLCVPADMPTIAVRAPIHACMRARCVFIGVELC
jgi:hypothetical protein